MTTQKSTCDQPTKIVWEVCAEMYANGMNPPLSSVYAACIARGVTVGTAKTQTYYYRDAKGLFIRRNK
jgi:hypothetical protein